ncbi:MAG TPA: aconitate hydratase [Nitrospina sp.]|jgi:aconitate hydratase|nr:aconitate hydratase [Nitrospinota bacterium]MDP6336540.1 aconitate hydratase [Nitrospinaceae bacterium]MDP7148363.1 aconitate hydratase [Nitrospinaceae bacterium]HAX46330.1 aconitate hydratase [Nitrospina sp.]|tara:strand:+ start:2336 stop:4591 length:2256 start_codon:yes stop_codon:yes gene_type:complete
MLLESAPIEKLFKSLEAVHEKARKNLGRPLTTVEKNLYSHMGDTDYSKLERGVSDIVLSPDRVAMQDATAQMAILQFMSAQMAEVAVPSTVHCDHLIQAHVGADKDLVAAEDLNREVYEFLRSAAMKYNMGFWKPGSGIIHQVVYENYAVPGTMMVGTDSHTPNAGGMGMIAVGVGGADAVDVMTGQGFTTKMPKLVGIHLKGKLNGWTAAKDVILKVATMLTAKGGTGKIVEYFGEGARALSATGKGTVTNMGAEIGATTSTFGYDDQMEPYLRATDRAVIADLCKQYADHLRSDAEVESDPEKYYDEFHEIDLDQLEPHIVGPHTPDLGRPVSAMAAEVDEKGYPAELSSALIGSCTNSSYEDMSRSVSLVRQAKAAGIKLKSNFLVTPGSEQVYQTIKQDGILGEFEEAGATVLANACGPCIGQWKREDKQKGEANSILTSYNRNFAKRNDGNPETLGFISSPELVVAMAFGGSMKFNPMTDTLKDKDGNDFKFDPPTGDVLPVNGYSSKDSGYEVPTKTGEVVINPSSERLAFLEPFDKQDPVADYKDLPLLLKAQGKCTTDHISQAGPWLKFRGHLDNISNNMFLGATNAYTGGTGTGNNPVSGEKDVELNKIARNLKDQGLGWVAVGDENIGEGSSREHAAMEPRHMGARAFIAKSYARIFEANLKKQGVLPLTFGNKDDYEKIQEKDKITISGLGQLTPGKTLTVTLNHDGGGSDEITVGHTMNADEIQWFYHGSALNYVGSQK